MMQQWTGKLVGIGAYTPERVVTNQELLQYMDTTDEWIQEKYGIRERRVAAPDENISDLSYHAAKRALEAANLQPEDLDLILLASINSDMRSPATACILQGKLGATNAVAFDMNIGGCPNAVFAMITALKYLDNKRFRRVMVVCTEIYTKFMDWSYRNTACFLGDGSGAVIFELSEPGTGVLGFNLYTDGSMYDKAYWPGGGTVEAPVEMQTPIIDGKAVWNFGHSKVPEVIRETVSDAGLAMEDVDFIIFHQANINIIRNVMDELGLPREKTHINNDRFANTGGASSLIAMEEAIALGKIKKGDRVVVCSYGAGLAWGAMLFHYV